MKAGTLDQRVTLEERMEIQDDWGQPIDAWVPVLDAWAAVEPLAGREYIAAMAEQSEVTARIRLRYRPGVRADMRVKHGTDTYGIESVIHIKSAARELQLMCRRVA